MASISGLALGAALGSALAGEAIRIESPTRQAQLIELYTSEGCSSCPPADRWLSGLKQDEQLWRRIVPVAFHVDYWNHLGWPDRFSSSAYGERQRHIARQLGSPTVYTPGFVVNGEEWRGWFHGRMLKQQGAQQAGKLTGEGTAGKLMVRYAPPEPYAGQLRIHAVRLGFDLHTEVGAGENGGRRLEHDFVVLAYKQQPLVAEGDLHTAAIELPPAREPAAHQGIALWVTQGNDHRPLQAAGGWIVRE